MTCVHNPFLPNNTLVLEHNALAGTRLRCEVCGGCSFVANGGAKIIPETCECHGAPEARAARVTSEPQ